MPPGMLVAQEFTGGIACCCHLNQLARTTDRWRGPVAKVGLQLALGRPEDRGSTLHTGNFLGLAIGQELRAGCAAPFGRLHFASPFALVLLAFAVGGYLFGFWHCLGHRSEEHTSELQSPCNLVCR